MKPPNIFTIFFTKNVKYFSNTDLVKSSRSAFNFQFSARLCRLLPKGRKNLQFIKVPSTLCSDASFASFQCLFLYSARHQHDSFQASPRTAAGTPTIGGSIPDKRRQASRQSAAGIPDSPPPHKPGRHVARCSVAVHNEALFYPSFILIFIYI